MATPNQTSAAISHGSSSCPSRAPGAFFDPRNGGECWSCPMGTFRTASAVDAQDACRTRVGLYEDCGVGAQCADGFTCQALAQRCVPEGLPLDAPEVCAAYRVDELADLATLAGVTMSYANGSLAAAGAAGAQELGTVYGQDGSFGCFITHCAGVISDVTVATYAVAGIYESFSDFEGSRTSTTQGVSLPGIEGGFSTAQVFNDDGALIGTADALSIGVGITPAQGGVLRCNTTVTDASASLEALDNAQRPQN